ncbi:hypothetical protein B0T18DRAFT_491784 [Schizothecium vesticola]|uniref:Secreted protein n=1 Tax=Schizothecium vesticola TaxID=314040 RepID=A0AA40K0G1_9PEZI|nr:hypothetical protein B0T18DRAFT_491784 [Schizothecium vesticola]
MHVLSLVPAFAGLAAALTIPGAGLESRQTTTAPASVSLAGITYAGSGCAASSLGAAALAKPGVIPVPRKVFVAKSGENNTRVAETRVNCQTTISLNHTAGWQYSVSEADYYGRVVLALGAEAISKTTYYFSGNTAQLSKQYYFDGPFNGIYFRNDRFDTGTRLWSPCGSGAMLNINTEVRVAPKSGMTSSKPASMEGYHLLGDQIEVIWKKC